MMEKFRSLFDIVKFIIIAICILCIISCILVLFLRDDYLNRSNDELSIQDMNQLYSNKNTISNKSTKYTDAEIELMARTVMSIAGSLSYEDKQKVVKVILNRLYSDKYPNTILDVIYQPNQFTTSINGHEISQDCYDAVYSIILDESVLTGEPLNFNN